MSSKKQPQFKNIMNFESWVQYGVDNGWCSPIYCDTHDGGYDYLTQEQRDEWDKGGDPCIYVMQMLED